MRRTLLINTGMVFCLLFLFMPFYMESQVSVVPNIRYEDDFCCVYFYPHVINPNDRLQDGPDSIGNQIRIKEDSLLIWVDLYPGMFFVHETKYILISHEDIRIVEGQWWPELNGKRILYGEKDKYAIFTPFSITNYKNDNIDVYIYPHEIFPFDQLYDGINKKIRIPDNTLLIWVDLLPEARFAHPTAYILIGKESTRVEKGGWMPVLNNRKILYGDLNKLGVISPFILRCQHIDEE